MSTLVRAVPAASPSTAAARAPADVCLRLLAAVAAVLSVASAIYFHVQGLTLLYPDAQARLLIARRVIDNPTPGLAQLGGVWLPLPQVVMLPLIWIDPLYYSGWAGSIPSMLSYVATVVLLYRLGLLVTASKACALITALIFLGNPNVLYLQATAMSELPLFMLTVATVYCLVAWSRDVSQFKYLMGAGLALMLAALTRYEGWALFLAAAGLVVWLCSVVRLSQARMEGYLLAFVVLPVYGIFLWLFWNQLIFHDFLYWQSSEYAKPALWVSSGEAAVGNLGVAAQTYLSATTYCTGLALALAAVAGLGLFLVRERLNRHTAGVLILLFPLPFFIVMLFLGQRPLHVPEISGDMYNIRFGLAMLLPVAVFCGYLGTRGPWARAAVTLLTCATIVWMGSSGSVITLNEPMAWQGLRLNRELREAAGWLAQHYDGGMILMESFGNESAQFQSGIPLARFIYEGNADLWYDALQNPGQYVTWVFTRHEGADADRVWDTLGDSAAFHAAFEPVHRNGAIEIYRRT